MKRLSTQKGFTLVECVVAMALLAIMTLGLLLILSVTVKTRNSNMEMEREIDRQVEEIMQIGDDFGGVPYSEPIEFQDENGDPVGAIPGEGQIITVSREEDAPDVVIGKLEYDYEATVTSESVSSDETITSFSTTSTSTGDIPNQQGKFKIYGGADIQDDTVNIKQYDSKTEMKGDTYTIAWQVEFTASTIAEEKSVKIVFPEGSFNITYIDPLKNCQVMKISKYVERIAPKNVGGVSAIFTFNITKADYEKYVCCIEKYFRNIYNTSGEDKKHKHIESAKVEINKEY